MRGEERVGNAGVTRRVEKEAAEKNRAIRTYFLLLLLFSDCDSLRCPSSEGGVAELLSFFGRVAGMIVGRGMIIGCNRRRGSQD